MDNKQQPRSPKHKTNTGNRQSAAFGRSESGASRGASASRGKPGFAGSAADYRGASASRGKPGFASFAAGSRGASAPRGAAKAAPRQAAPAPSRSYPVQENAELLAFLLQTVKGEGRNAIKAMLSRGQIAVDGKTQKVFNYALKPGQTVTVSKERIVEAPPLIGLSILYEDDDLIVVVKEAGLLSIASDQESELTAYRQLTAHVRLTDPNNRIFVVHRLDRDTSGVMMFAKSERVQQELQHTWQDTVKERTYIALVEGQVKKQEGTISSYLKESKTLKMYSTSNPTDAQHAVTHYKVLQSNRNYSLLEVSLETGRKNQIRVHMEDIGHPIVGDKKYGSKSRAIPRLGLHARLLAFLHPSTGKLVRFETDIPKLFLNPFKDGFIPK
ncbi:RluA family pseudouridine synthase [Paenibacillus sp. CF384]|uniref:RluA family pseudouridine synthase n=1 Tax=Paenibacillus sp. CF384 TaxID=1884382 RepID=UPI000897066E|nr:RluA family pseudouridine synthase [Paenibacillus sp. CF384]SDW45239.1 23S rRNA pseudouridine1911/1915/1917 synthase [Paenibacillus sp. CF384]